MDHSPELHTSKWLRGVRHAHHTFKEIEKNTPQHGDLELPKFGEGECKHRGGIWRVLSGGVVDKLQPAT